MRPCVWFLRAGGPVLVLERRWGAIAVENAAPIVRALRERTRALHICILAHWNEPHAGNLYQELHDALEPGTMPKIIHFPDGNGGLMQYESGTTISLIGPRWGPARSHQVPFDASVETQLIRFVNSLTPPTAPCSAVELLMCRLTDYDCHVIIVSPPLPVPVFDPLPTASEFALQPADDGTASPPSWRQALAPPPGELSGGDAAVMGAPPISGDDGAGDGGGGGAGGRVTDVGVTVGGGGGDAPVPSPPGAFHPRPPPSPTAGAAAAAAAALLEAACARLHIAPPRGGPPTADAVAAVAAAVRAEAADVRRRRARAAGEAWAVRVLRPVEEVAFGAISPSGVAAATYRAGGWALTFARARGGDAWSVTLRRPAAEPTAVREAFGVHAALRLERGRGDKTAKLLIPAGASEGVVRGWVHDGVGVLRVRAIFETGHEGGLKAEGAVLWADVEV